MQITSTKPGTFPTPHLLKNVGDGDRAGHTPCASLQLLHPQLFFPKRVSCSPGYRARMSGRSGARLRVTPGRPQPRTRPAPRGRAPHAAGTGPAPGSTLPCYRRCRAAGWAPGWERRRRPRTVPRAGPGRGRAGTRKRPPATCCAAPGRAGARLRSSAPLFQPPRSAPGPFRSARPARLGGGPSGLGTPG